MSNQCYYCCCCCSVACVLYSLSSFFFISYSAPLTARAWKQFRSVVSSHLKPNSMYQAAIAAAHCCWYSMMNIMNYSVDFTHIIFFCLVYFFDRFGFHFFIPIHAGIM